MQHAQRHVLVVDDDPRLRDEFQGYLSAYAFQVSTAPDGAAMKRILAARPVDLVVLDLELGAENGLDLMRGVIDRDVAPVISLTGAPGEAPDKVVALELGADDCISKPVNPRELLARIRTVLRRAGPARLARSRPRARWRFVGWEADLRRRSLTAPDGALVKLTAAEFNLLAALLKTPSQVLSRQQLVAACRVHPDEVTDRSIDVMILRLRRKLAAWPDGQRIIRTERGAGYALAVAVETV
ncbi:MAG: response regulator [Pseudomonadota bacterium]|jgi:two-component system OmpR family response regulator|uniref:response regulator n=1 Tax=Caulobacter sp. CCH9-E1 TaxID=1768768 RepID=UPI000831B83C|nr:response regulator [Caulobacter sp. CCH9-E1]